MNKKLPLNPLESDALLYIILSALLMFSVNKAFSQSQLLVDINQMADNTYNEYSNFVGGPERLYFVSEGRDLYSTELVNGVEQTKKIKTFLSAAQLTLIGETLYFTANDGLSGHELWKSDGSEAGTVLVKDIRTGTSGSIPESLTNVDGMLYFVANNGTNSKEVRKGNGILVLLFS
jgi:ELWxxDGT repeat protein